LTLCAVLALVLMCHVQLIAQQGVTLSGRLLNSISGAPIAGATVQIDELRRTTTSGADGSFSFPNVLPSTYHLSIRSDGYSTRRTEVVVGNADVRTELTVDPELHFEEVTTVTGEARSQFDVFQPTAVLAGQELGKQIEMSLGATLENQPGVAARSFGPAPARPVIRGLDGDRVQILQDGQRMGDLSSQSGDHAVTVNPAAATRIEVVRGPATLLYGANAVGGLVNVITEDIPTRPVTGASGNVTFDLGSAADEAPPRPTSERVTARSPFTPVAEDDAPATSRRPKAIWRTRNRETASPTSAGRGRARTTMLERTTRTTTPSMAFR
jgi:iron complex outermembrane receptor protein